MTTQHPAAGESLDLDKLEAEVRTYEAGGYIRAHLKIGDARALIALARRATQQPSEADEWDGWEAAAKAVAQRAEGQRLAGRDDLFHELRQCASMLHDMKPARAALTHRATTAEQQAAAIPDGWLLARREPSHEQLEYAAYNINRKRNGPDAVTPEFMQECWATLLHSRPGLKPAATTASAGEPDHFYTFNKPDGWINLLNPLQSWEEWTRTQGIPTTRGWKVHGSAPSREAEGLDDDAIDVIIAANWKVGLSIQEYMRAVVRAAMSAAGRES